MSDHERGCQGREYTCTCGYDAERDALIETLTATLEEIAGARWNEDGDLDDVCTVADRALEAAKEQSQ